MIINPAIAHWEIARPICRPAVFIILEIDLAYKGACRPEGIFSHPLRRRRAERFGKGGELRAPNQFGGVAFAVGWTMSQRHTPWLTVVLQFILLLCPSSMPTMV
jgi:hypothetical protein